MKTFTAALLLAFACAAGAAAQDAHHADHKKHETTAADAKDSGGVVRRGTAIGAESKRVAFTDALKEPRKYDGKTVVIEGVVRQVCQAEGCWVEIGPKEGAGSVRVTFDHKFVVPKDSAEMNFRAEGTLKVKTLSKETVEHLVKDDGAKIKTNPDGTADELSFNATGVELWK